VNLTADLWHTKLSALGGILLQFLEKLFFKRRKDHRYLIHNGSLVIVFPAEDGTKIKWTVKVIDMSLGGTAFIYEGSPDDLAKSGLIRLSNGLPEAAKYETVSDVECSEGSTYRRRGVKFEWKGVLGKKQIMEFIKVNGLQAGGLTSRRSTLSTVRTGKTGVFSES
jgi:hypothetical protein